MAVGKSTAGKERTRDVIALAHVVTGPYPARTNMEARRAAAKSIKKTAA